jgi:hypothetical protein
MRYISNTIIFICVFLVIALIIEDFNATNEKGKEKDTWILRCMIGLDRTAADCEVYYRVLKDHQDDKQP